MSKSWIDSLFKASDARKAVADHRKDYEIAIPYLDRIYEAAKRGEEGIVFRKESNLTAYQVADVLRRLEYIASYEPITGELIVHWGSKN